MGSRMTTITWKGDGSADVNEWYGIRFPVGEPVEITPDKMPNGVPVEKLVEKARTNRFFEVSEDRPDIIHKLPEPPVNKVPMSPDEYHMKPATIPADTAWSEREQAYLPEKKGMPMPVKRRGRPRKVVS